MVRKNFNDQIGSAEALMDMRRETQSKILAISETGNPPQG